MTTLGQPIDPKLAATRSLQQIYTETYTSGKSTITVNTNKIWKEGTTPVKTTPGGYDTWTFTLCDGSTSVLSADPGSGGHGGTIAANGNITPYAYC